MRCNPLMLAAANIVLWRKGETMRCCGCKGSTSRGLWWSERKRQSGEMQSSDIRQSLEIQMDGEAT